ncbi:hypothetical protein [Oecophyllibacter saccharovorans]|uniref:hypothetical protein n=1 Tax=Oecophyllibacter saccharovorans TaxID=2558360 RepID=UPI001E437110|nr:hypothetical protein [Oecophyllibacter saccharovorans]
MRLSVFSRSAGPVAHGVFHGAVLCGLMGLTAALSGCSTPDASSSPYGQWRGKLVTDDGACPTSDESILRIRGKEIVFSPANGAQVLHGTYNPKSARQHYQATLDEKGMNGQPYHMVFNGYPVGMTIGGTYLSPRCRAHVTLVRD